MRTGWTMVVLLLGPIASVAAADPETALPMPRPESGTAALGLPDLIRISLERNPALEQARLDIEAAQGRAVQAGLYPNPTLGAAGDELGARDGPAGFISAPIITQDIVTAGKLRLSRRAALKQVDQAHLLLLGQRYTLLTAVRQGYFDVLAVDRRLTILTELLQLAEQSLTNAEKLLKGNQVSELDVLPFRIDRERLAADLQIAHVDRTAAWQRLTAVLGTPDLPCAALVGSLEMPTPAYDLAPVRAAVLETNPNILVAEAGVARAELLLQRARVEPIPNVSVGAGYVRNNMRPGQDEWRFQVGMPVPLFNRNQGNIQEAQAQLGRSREEVRRVQHELLQRLATAYGTFDGARQRAERYRGAILPSAREAYRLSLLGFRGGQFEYLRLVQAQQALATVNLEYNQILLDVWRAASEIAGLLSEEEWGASGKGWCAAAP